MFLRHYPAIVNLPRTWKEEEQPVDINTAVSCPVCGADWRGEDIVECLLHQMPERSREEVENIAKEDYGYGEEGRPQFFLKDMVVLVENDRATHACCCICQRIFPLK